MDEVVCNPMIVCVNHKFREFESITVGLGRKKTMIDLNSHQTKIYEHEWSPSWKEWAYFKPTLFYHSRMSLFVFVLRCWDLAI